jgi:transcriptional regulator with XRE-family HTH domain
MPLRTDGQAIRRRRELTGMTITEFAARLGYSLNHCSQVELGNYNGGPRFRKAAAALLDCTIDDITDVDLPHAGAQTEASGNAA